MAALLVFGPSAAALYAVPVGAGLVLVAAVYGTMLLLSRDRVLAAAAALVTGANNYRLFNSSFIFPDTVATATFTAGFLCLLLGGTRTRREERREGWIPAIFVIGAGALFGWTYLAREFSPILLPAVVVTVVLLRYRLRHVAMLAGGPRSRSRSSFSTAFCATEIRSSASGCSSIGWTCPSKPAGRADGAHPGSAERRARHHRRLPAPLAVLARRLDLPAAPRRLRDRLGPVSG